jgi:diguanylate cyclase (GGDEF)-like protein
VSRRESEVSHLLHEITHLKDAAGLGTSRFAVQTRLLLDLAGILEEADEAGATVPAAALAEWSSRSDLVAVVVWQLGPEPSQAIALFEQVRPLWADFGLGKVDHTRLPSTTELASAQDRTMRIDLEDLIIDETLVDDDAVVYADFQVMPISDDGSIVIGAAQSEPGPLPVEPLLLTAAFALRSRARRLAVVRAHALASEQQVEEELALLRATRRIKYATLADHQAVIPSSLVELAAAFGVEKLEWWRCDERRSSYVLEYSSAQEQHVVGTAPFGERPWLDRCRTAEGAVELQASSTDAGPIVRISARTSGTEDGPCLFVGTSSHHQGDFGPIVRARFERVSQLLDSVAARLDQERRSTMLFESSPLPIAVRDGEKHSLISCNEAFRVFTGLDAATMVAGMDSATFEYTTAADLPDEMRDDHAWMFDVLDDLRPSPSSRAVVLRSAGGAPRIGVVTDAQIDATANLIATTVLDVTESARSERQTRLRLTRDDLTGMLSRPGLREQFEQMVSARHSAVVALVDIDRFASINHAFGFAFGDEMLKTVAGRLQDHATDLGVVARLAGDQFAMVLRGPLRRDRVDALIDRIIDDVLLPIHPPNSSTAIAPSISVGITTSRSIDDFDRALTRAEGAMRASKRRGGRTATRSDADSTDGARLQLTTEAELFRAIEQEELRVFFQPIVDLGPRTVIGAEALVRWQHPTKGLLPAGAFIQTAIDVGLEEQVTNFVLPTALQAAERWQQDYGPLYVSVNLATSQMRLDTDVVDHVSRALAESGLAPDRLQLEVTETAMIRDLEQADSVLRRLRALGVRILLDDFGAGYSALSYLRKLSIDGIKIDRSFVTGLGTPAEIRDRELSEASNRAAGNDPFVRLIASAAELLDLDCIAEGIESESELERLREIGIRAGQGYLFARPMSDRGLREFLEGQATTRGAPH